jgi:chondroitin AC lyase
MFALLLLTIGASVDDLHLVKERLVRQLIPSSSGASAAVATARQLEATMVPGNCTWPDIDYHEFRRAGWPMESHLGRVLEIAVGWKVLNTTTATAGATTVALTNRGTLLHAAQCSLQLWLDHDFLNPNWFDNMITTPRLTSDTALLLGDALTPATLSQIVEITKRSVWEGCPIPQPKCGSPAQHYPPWTGANIADMLAIQINRGVLMSNTTVVSQAFRVAFEACVLSPQAGDGIMVDSAFHQHGPQLLSGAYGEVFTSTIIDFVVLSTKTARCFRVAEVWPDRGCYWVLHILA